MDGDRPIRRAKDDRLGFAPVAEHLARAIVDQSAKDGLVFGIEGKWGSGKSTLINLTIEALKNHEHVAPEVIDFSPWLVGDRDTLLQSLFDELATAAVNIDPTEAAVAEAIANQSSWQNLVRRFIRDKHWQLRQKERLKKQIGGMLRFFGRIAGTAGKLARVAGVFGVPGANLTGIAINHGGKAVSSLGSGGSLSKRKSELVAALKLLSRNIVVFVDDLDRLEPFEASEVLRLIRAVADFPNVIYVLCYDPEVVADTLTKAVQIDDGVAFLAKIVQVSFRVPRPEAFDLRSWFKSEVHSLFADELDAAGEHQRSVRQRLLSAIDVLGGRYLETPRDVVRVLNALRLHVVPVRTLIDLPDMIWLQLVRIGNPALYAWVEEYLTESSAIANRATISNESAQAMGSRLNKILTAEGVDVDRAMFDLQEILPGVGGGMEFGDDREPRRVFNNLGEHTFNRFVVDRRLGSPQHYRYYFAFSEPADALRDDQVHAFVSAAENAPADALAIFVDLTGQVRRQGGAMAEVLVDRLTAWSDRIPEAATLGIFAAFAESMDNVALSSRDGDFGQHRAWLSTGRAVKVLLERTEGDVRAACLCTLFTEGPALGWLTSILRDKIFSHGHYGNHAVPEDQWLLSAAEFDVVLETMLRRYRNAPAEDLLRVPNMMSLLYGWQQGSGTDEARTWVERQTTTDAGLLAFLSRARGWANGGDGVYYPLKQRDLENFLDYDAAVRRLERLAPNAKASDGERQAAAELLEAIRQGEGN